MSNFAGHQGLPAEPARPRLGRLNLMETAPRNLFQPCLSHTMRVQANELARREGVSLNQSIARAVAVKITRTECTRAHPSLIACDDAAERAPPSGLRDRNEPTMRVPFGCASTRSCSPLELRRRVLVDTQQIVNGPAFVCPRPRCVSRLRQPRTDGNFRNKRFHSGTP